MILVIACHYTLVPEYVRLYEDYDVELSRMSRIVLFIPGWLADWQPDALQPYMNVLVVVIPLLALMITALTWLWILTGPAAPVCRRRALTRAMMVLLALSLCGVLLAILLQLRIAEYQQAFRGAAPSRFYDQRQPRLTAVQESMGFVVGVVFAVCAAACALGNYRLMRQRNGNAPHSSAVAG